MFDLNKIIDFLSGYSTQTLLLLGSIFLFLGISVLMGGYKKWFWKKQDFVYAYIPISFLFFFANNESIINNYFGNRVFFTSLVLVILLLILLIIKFKPEFLKPAWIRYIEEQPENIQEYIREETIPSGIDWQKHFRSKATIKAWIEENKKGSNSIFNKKGKSKVQK